MVHGCPFLSLFYCLPVFFLNYQIVYFLTRTQNQKVMAYSAPLAMIIKQPLFWDQSPLLAGQITPCFSLGHERTWRLHFYTTFGEWCRLQCTSTHGLLLILFMLFNKNQSQTLVVVYWCGVKIQKKCQPSLVIHMQTQRNWRLPRVHLREQWKGNEDKPWTDLYTVCSIITGSRQVMR